MISQIWHPFDLWEDYKAGFYDNIGGKNKDELINKSVEMFSNNELTKTFMEKVTNEWVYSCEHNLSNMSINRIAYIGQAACCIYGGVPSTLTMQAWSLVSKSNRDIADKLAQEVINKWEQKQVNKLQLCLKLD
jgi:hypothetical protein